MHSYGRWPDAMFNQVEECASEIGTFCSRWGRIGVVQTKEKFGTVRVYCHFGWDSIYGIVFPRHHWVKSWWPYKFDLLMSSLLMRLLNIIVVPIQKSIYRYAYKRAVKKYPRLREEIFSCADFGEVLEGVEGYKHRSYWQEVN